MTRRRFLRRTLIGAVMLGAGAVVGRHLSGYALDPAVATRLRVLSAKEYLVLMAACRRLLAPDADGAPTPDTIQVGLVIDHYLSVLDPVFVTDVKALLHLLEHAASLRGRFSHLDGPAQDAVLLAWQRSRLDVKRRGLQALKTLAMLGYYDDPTTFAVAGYGGPLIGLGR